MAAGDGGGGFGIGDGGRMDASAVVPTGDGGSGGTGDAGNGSGELHGVLLGRTAPAVPEAERMNVQSAHETGGQTVSLVLGERVRQAPNGQDVLHALPTGQNVDGQEFP